jgi:hypothetical protein
MMLCSCFHAHVAVAHAHTRTHAAISAVRVARVAALVNPYDC